MDKSFRKKKMSYARRISWYANKLRQQRDQVKELCRRSLNKPQNQYFKIQYEHELAKYKLHIKSVKRNSRIKYC